MSSSPSPSTLSSYSVWVVSVAASYPYRWPHTRVSSNFGTSCSYSFTTWPHGLGYALLCRHGLAALGWSRRRRSAPGSEPASDRRRRGPVIREEFAAHRANPSLSCCCFTMANPKGIRLRSAAAASCCSRRSSPESERAGRQATARASPEVRGGIPPWHALIFKRVHGGMPWYSCGCTEASRPGMSWYSRGCTRRHPALGIPRGPGTFPRGISRRPATRRPAT